jgi:hypothetical protein
MNHTVASIATGMPPRRVWLELRKLAAMDEKLPGSWTKALVLAYHLGLLQHLFPWLRGSGQPAVQQALIASRRLLDRTGAAAAAARVAAAAGAGAGAAAATEGGGGGGGGGGVRALPLELRVAALVHPSSSQAVYEMVRAEGWGRRGLRARAVGRAWAGAGALRARAGRRDARARQPQTPALV